MTAAWQQTVRKRRWLAAHQQLLRTFTSYCAVHGSQGVGLASARMELLLLMLELHQESAPRQLTQPVPARGSFPLLTACVASYKTDVAGPIRFLHGQIKDLLVAFAEQTQPPFIQQSLARVCVR